MINSSNTPVRMLHPAQITIRGEIVSAEAVATTTLANGQIVQDHIKLVIVQDFEPQNYLVAAELGEQRFPVTLWQQGLVQTYHELGLTVGSLVELQGHLVLTKKDDQTVVPKIWALSIGRLPQEVQAQLEQLTTGIKDETTGLTTPTATDKPRKFCIFTRLCTWFRSKTTTTKPAEPTQPNQATTTDTPVTTPEQNQPTATTTE